MPMIRTEHTVFRSEEHAKLMVATLEIAEVGTGNDWEYRVKVDPNGSGKAVIEIYDDEGMFLGLL